MASRVRGARKGSLNARLTSSVPADRPPRAALLESAWNPRRRGSSSQSRPLPVRVALRRPGCSAFRVSSSRRTFEASSTSTVEKVSSPWASGRTRPGNVCSSAARSGRFEHSCVAIRVNEGPPLAPLTLEAVRGATDRNRVECNATPGQGWLNRLRVCRARGSHRRASFACRAAPGPARRTAATARPGCRYCVGAPPPWRPPLPRS